MESKIHYLKLSNMLLCGLLSYSQLQAAPEVSEPEIEHELAPYVVVATRTPLELERVSPSVEYISLSEIENWQDQSLVDTLMRQPGINLKTNGSHGAVASLFLRGTNSDQTALFLDGRRMNRAMSGQYNLEFLNVDNLNSVQIQKGASSVNYGSSGIGGVVDLQSQRTLGKNATNGSITGFLGSNKFKKGTLTFQTSKEDWGISLSHTRLSTDNERPNDGLKSTSSNFRGDIRLTPSLTAELVGSYREHEKRVPGSASYPTPKYFTDSKNWLLSPGLRFQNNDVNIHAFYSREYFSSDDTGFLGAISYPRLKTDEINLQFDYNGIDAVTLTLGGLYRDETIRKGTYYKALDQTGGFAQALWQINEAFEIRGGLRFDSYSDYEDSWTWNAELIYFVPNTDLSIFTKIASAYAPPSGQDIGYDSNKDANGNTVDTPILPEESLSYEIGMRQKILDEKLQWSAVIFRNNIDNYIRYVQYDDTDFSISDTLNAKKAMTEGVEFSLDYKLNPKLSLNFAYTYLTAVYDSYITDSKNYEEIRLSYRPRHSLQFSALYEATDALNLGLSVIGQCDRQRDNWQAYNSDTEDYVVLNCVAEYQLLETLSLLGRIDNLLDESYATSYDYPNLGTSIYFGVRVKF